MNKKIILWIFAMVLLAGSTFAAEQPLTEEQFNKEARNAIRIGIQEANAKQIVEFQVYVKTNFPLLYPEFEDEFSARRIKLKVDIPPGKEPYKFGTASYVGFGSAGIALVIILLLLIGRRASPAKRLEKNLAKSEGEEKVAIEFKLGLSRVEEKKESLMQQKAKLMHAISADLAEKEQIPRLFEQTKKELKKIYAIEGDNEFNKWLREQLKEKEGLLRERNLNQLLKEGLITKEIAGFIKKFILKLKPGEWTPGTPIINLLIGQTPNLNELETIIKNLVRLQEHLEKNLLKVMKMKKQELETLAKRSDNLKAVIAQFHAAEEDISRETDKEKKEAAAARAGTKQKEMLTKLSYEHEKIIENYKKLEDKEKQELRLVIDAYSRLIQIHKDVYSPLNTAIEQFLRYANAKTGQLGVLEKLRKGESVADNINTLNTCEQAQQKLFAEEKKLFAELKQSRQFEEHLKSFFKEEAGAIKGEAAQGRYLEALNKLISTKAEADTAYKEEGYEKAQKLYKQIKILAENAMGIAREAGNSKGEKDVADIVKEADEGIYLCKQIIEEYEQQPKKPSAPAKGPVE